jgi:transcriptional regulator with XRE-family HTH domain
MAGVGTLLRRFREAAGLSQEELAERAGLSARGVSDLERGLRRSPYPATLRRLALALELPPEDRALLLAAAHAAPEDGAHARSPMVEQGAYLGARAAFGLVGRQRELVEVTRALDSALAGSGRLLVLSGEAGIGKTRLAQELAVLAGARGCILATGRTYEPQQGVAFYPFLDALAMLHARAPAAVRQTLSARWPYL